MTNKSIKKFQHDNKATAQVSMYEAEAVVLRSTIERLNKQVAALSDPSVPTDPPGKSRPLYRDWIFYITITLINLAILVLGSWLIMN